jgi:hypothetical protein
MPYFKIDWENFDMVGHFFCYNRPPDLDMSIYTREMVVPPPHKLFVRFPEDTGSPDWSQVNRSYINRRMLRMRRSYFFGRRIDVNRVVYQPNCHWWDVFKHDIVDELAVYNLNRDNIFEDYPLELRPSSRYTNHLTLENYHGIEVSTEYPGYWVLTTSAYGFYRRLDPLLFTIPELNDTQFVYFFELTDGEKDYLKQMARFNVRVQIFNWLMTEWE